MTARTLVLVAVTVVLTVIATALVLRSATTTVVERRAPVVIERQPPSILEVPAEPVVVSPTDDLRDLVDTYPIGTRFDLLPGLYRQQYIIPRHAQEFIGRDGVVFTGAVDLDPERFERTPEGWWAIGDQTQEGLTTGQVEPGNEADRHPEEVFVDGDHRLDHVGSPDLLGPGAWHFDYAGDRIVLYDDPRSFDSLETSVHEFAFGGLAVRDVVIANITVEKYASPHYYGALGGSEDSYPTYGWTYRDVVVRHNHGAGIAVGPGTTIERSRIHHNGQIGLVGEGISPFDGYAAPVTVTATEIDHNLQLGFRWQHEGGGTKFKRMEAGMTFTGNWVHDNNGPGAWWDVYNRDVVVRDNLVQDNGAAGIYYEIGYGDTVIADNVVHGNERGGVEVSTSLGVLVTGNVLWDNGDGLVAFHDSQQIGEIFPDGLRDVRFVDNEVWLDANGFNGVEVYGAPQEIQEQVTFTGNVYHEVGPPLYLYDDEEVDAATWLARHPEDVLGASDTPVPDALAEDLLAAFRAAQSAAT